MGPNAGNPFWRPGSGPAELAADADTVAPRLTPYLPAGNAPTAAAIVCPGGAYERLAPHEGEPIARWLNALGIAAFVLNYRVAPHRWPAPLNDARRAIRLVRHHAGAWRVDPRRVGVVGFSAGGHLAAALGTDHDEGGAGATDPVERESSRPDFLVLGYALIDPALSRPRQTPGTAPTTPSAPADPNPRGLPTLDARVTAATPPTFLWHTADDPRVLVENSLRFASALGRYGVPFALHVFPEGRHGLGLAQDDPIVGNWPGLCAAWLAGH